jgi:hypothetical protein
MMKIENEGRIGTIELPGEWHERDVQRQPLGLKQMRTFHSVENKNVQVRFIYRGHAESEETGRGLRACLSSPPRALDSADINSLAPILGDLAEPAEFNIVGAQTMDLAGRRVLWVEGRWLDSPYWSGTVFIDADGTGCVIQQVECFAELSMYEHASPAFQQILRSIQWK